MCELFGVNSAGKIRVNEQLKEFVSHSANHNHGWGIASYNGVLFRLEKEPIQASKSEYLARRLQRPIEVSQMIAHIRLATVGTMEYENCHPFVKEDCQGRTWLLAHNGTLFDCPQLNRYRQEQEGGTDSERILCYLVDHINQKQQAFGRALTAKERFLLLDEKIAAIADRNKLNLLIYDGELMYAHTNYANSLYVRRAGDTLLFATVPLDQEKWLPHPFTTLCAYRDGEQIYQGTDHGKEYQDNEQDMKYLFANFSGL